jgi:hypothetical protein
LKTLRTYLGRAVRGIGRKIAADATLKEIFAHPLRLARRVREQRHRQRQPTVSNLDAPEVDCIGKGKVTGAMNSASKSWSQPRCTVVEKGTLWRMSTRCPPLL